MKSTLFEYLYRNLDYGPCLFLGELLMGAYPLTNDLLALYVYPSLEGFM